MVLSDLIRLSQLLCHQVLVDLFLVSGNVAHAVTIIHACLVYNFIDVRGLAEYVLRLVGEHVLVDQNALVLATEILAAKVLAAKVLATEVLASEMDLTIAMVK